MTLRRTLYHATYVRPHEDTLLIMGRLPGPRLIKTCIKNHNHVQFLFHVLPRVYSWLLASSMPSLVLGC